jgi:hypothetical protein
MRSIPLPFFSKGDAGELNQRIMSVCRRGGTLAAFDRVRIEAGQSKSVTPHVPLRRLQY